MRLFAALPLSSAATERLLSLRLRLSSPKDGLRWSAPEQWHITLLFFGETNAEQRDLLLEGFAQLEAQAPGIKIEHLGLFPAKGILFAAVEPSEALTALQKMAKKLCLSAGLPVESRPFHPHLTLARSKSKAGHASLQRMNNPELPSLGNPIRWTPEQVLLLESTLLPQGAVYTVQASRSLRQST